MSDYTITTDFGAKDSLPSGNAAKIIKGSEFTTEFTNIKTAVNTKADTAGDTFTGAVTFDAAVTVNSTATITGDLTVDTNTLFVDVSENRVGIGTTSPDRALHVSTADNLPIFAESTDDLCLLGLGDNAGTVAIAASGSSFGVYTGGGVGSGTGFGTEKMRIDSSGNVGIGTNSPAYTLDIEADTAQARIHSTVGNSVLRLDSVDAGESKIFFADNSASAIGTIEYHHDSNYMSFDTVATERMRIDSSGNVGIGTTSPTTALDLNGELAIRGGEGVDDARMYFRASDNSNRFTIETDLDATTSNDILGFRSTLADNILTLKGDGNVGIGTTSITDKLTVYGGIKAIQSDSVNTSAIALDFDSDIARVRSTVNGTGTQRPLGFFIGGSENMRIDSSGNVLVGKTSGGALNTAGIELRPNNLYATSDNSVPIYVNRKTTDGELVQFRRDGATVGTIGTTYQSGVRYMHIAGASTGIGFYSGGIFPCDSSGTFANNSKDLGSSTVKWDNVYATNGTIQTSDRNEKQGIRELLDAEQRVATACKGLLRAFKWNSAVEEKGDEARIHFGIIAQDLQDAFTAEGLDAGDYAMFINSTWTDEETGEERSSMGVRYSELLAFIISAI